MVLDYCKTVSFFLGEGEGLHVSLIPLTNFDVKSEDNPFFLRPLILSACCH